ncbi:hypothetical protein GPECTOR_33g650 [Gonium pectorale]|uniref:Uncharacterized protein n=1 Tax=Gonium pectorale TaxID=33097 RepID=A0A150GD79_GONPE|nr:hypothetical protein GPECTOR_33g650 [Gonium pectorale]|eukprot:KXZ47768.1 hypothetical protein GPECTOR_33g650 [Gonium pectorale]
MSGSLPSVDPAGVEALATRVRQLLWVVLDSVPAELVEWSLLLVRLLHAADTFPRGGLYGGHYAVQACLRYEGCWLPLLARAAAGAARKGKGKPPPPLVPPLDVALAWLLHRVTQPAAYASDCEQSVGVLLDPPPGQAFRFAGARAYTHNDTPLQRAAWASREAWDADYVFGSGNEEGARGGGGGGGGGGSARGGVRSRGGGRSSGEAQGPWFGSGPGDGNGGGGGGGGSHKPRSPFWPPAPPGSRWDLATQKAPPPPTVAAGGGKGDVGALGGGGGGGGGGGAALGGRSRLAGALCGRMSELCPLLHSLLRPAYLDPDVLAQAVQRYCRFLMLQAMHPHVPCVPTTDIALMWVAHMAVPAAYRDTCRRLLGAGASVAPSPGALRLDDRGPAFEETRRLYEHHFGEVYDPPLTRAVPLSTPHPLLSSPLAPFLPAFDTAAAAASATSIAGAAAAAEGLRSPAAVAAAVELDELADDGAAASGGGGDVGGRQPSAPLIRVQPAGAGAVGSHQRFATAAGAAVPPAGLHCGAHALYLAYLLRRGARRGGRNLLGLVLGQAHRRRAAVRHVADKAARFWDFKHLPHSDCHPYWRKLRLRTVDPASVAAASYDAQYNAQQVDELYGNGDGSDGEEDGSDGDSDGGSAAAAASRPNRRRRASWMEQEDADGADADSAQTQEQPRPRRQVRAPAAAASVSGWAPPTRIVIIMPLPASAPAPDRGRRSGGGGAGAGDSGNEASPRGTESGAGTPPAGRSERSSRNAPSETASSSYSQPLVSRRRMRAPAEPEPPVAVPAVQPAATVDPPPASAVATGGAEIAPEAAAVGPAAGAWAAGSAGGSAPGVGATGAVGASMSGSFSAAAAAAKAPFRPAGGAGLQGRTVSSSPRRAAALEAAPPPAPPAPIPATTDPWAAAAPPPPPPAAGEPAQGPSTNYRPPDEGRVEWSYHNPHFVDKPAARATRTVGTGDGPLSPIPVTPPPASAIWISAAAAAAAYSPETPETATTDAASAAASAVAAGGGVTAASPSDATSAVIVGGTWATATATDKPLPADGAAAGPTVPPGGVGPIAAAAIGPTEGAKIMGGMWATRVSQATRPDSLAEHGDGSGRRSRRGSHLASGPVSGAASAYLSLPGSRGGSNDGAAVDGDDGGGGGGDAAAAVGDVMASAGIPLLILQSGSDEAADGAGGSAFLTPLASSAGEQSGLLPAAQPPGSSPSPLSAARVSGPSPSRLSRVSSATDVRSGGLPFPIALRPVSIPSPSAAGSTGSPSRFGPSSPSKPLTGLSPTVSIRVPGLPTGLARTPGLPPGLPRPQPPSGGVGSYIAAISSGGGGSGPLTAPAAAAVARGGSFRRVSGSSSGDGGGPPAAAAATAAAAAAPGGGSRRASGGYSRADAAYFTGMGGVAEMAGRGDEEQGVFGQSLRERYAGPGSGVAYSAVTGRGFRRSSGGGSAASGYRSGLSSGGATPALSNQSSFKSAGSDSGQEQQGQGRGGRGPGEGVGSVGGGGGSSRRQSGSGAAHKP